MTAAETKLRRRLSVTIEVGADDHAAMIRLLNHFVENVDGGSRDGCSGGYDSGGYYTVIENPEMTHDRYVAELEAHLEEKRREKESKS